MCINWPKSKLRMHTHKAATLERRHFVFLSTLARSYDLGSSLVGYCSLSELFYNLANGATHARPESSVLSADHSEGYASAEIPGPSGVNVHATVCVAVSLAGNGHSTNDTSNGSDATPTRPSRKRKRRPETWKRTMEANKRGRVCVTVNGNVWGRHVRANVSVLVCSVMYSMMISSPHSILC